MPQNKLEDLRNHLFEAIEMLKEGDMELNTAKTINQLGSTIVESAKVEADVLKTIAEATGEIRDAKFLGSSKAEEPKQLINGQDREIIQ